jgi:Mce-associated membrane protein
MTIPAPPQIADTEEVVATPPRRVTGVATLVALVAVLVMAVGAAATNDALVDKDATAQVSAQISDAVKRVYSYDFARLDDNERAAGEVVTGPFVDIFRQQFAKIRKLAPPQEAVVVASVPAIAVKSLNDNRAIVLVFLDQQARQAGKDKPLLATGRLSITAQRVDGRWKIADAESF